MVLLTRTRNDVRPDEVCFTVIDKTRGVVGEWRTKMPWPRAIKGWASGVVVDRLVLSWDHTKVDSKHTHTHTTIDE